MIDKVGLGDTVYLWNGQAILITEEQDVMQSTWRKNLSDLDASTGELRRFNYNEVESISLSNGAEIGRDEKPFIDHFYVSADGNGERDGLQVYPDYVSAKEAYFSLDYVNDRVLGVQNVAGDNLDFIRCGHGVDEVVMDCKKVMGWNNSDIYMLVEQIGWDLITNERQEIAYAVEDKFIFIQTCEDGYDYIIYDSDYQLLDGGVYDDGSISIFEAAREAIDRADLIPEQFQVVDVEELKEWAEKINAIEKPILERDELPSVSLNNYSPSEIESTVYGYVQGIIDEYGLDVEVKGVKVYGSRSRSLEHEDSDFDVAVSYIGGEREDNLFTIFNEYGIMVGGMKVDINPISEERTGTLEEFIERANQFLDEKVADMEEKPKQVNSFYVAECMEFTHLGEYHDNLSLEEAVQVYESIPAERMNGLKGIGFTLSYFNESDETWREMDCPLYSGGIIDVDMISSVPEFIDSKLVQQVVKEIRKRFPGVTIMESDTEEVKTKLEKEGVSNLLASGNLKAKANREKVDTYGSIIGRLRVKKTGQSKAMDLQKKIKNRKDMGLEY